MLRLRRIAAALMFGAVAIASCASYPGPWVDMIMGVTVTL